MTLLCHTGPALPVLGFDGALATEKSFLFQPGLRPCGLAPDKVFVGKKEEVGQRPLARTFYERDTLTVARELLGARLVRVVDGVRLSGVITETEAYIGETDLACHAKAGRTPRT